MFSNIVSTIALSCLVIATEASLVNRNYNSEKKNNNYKQLLDFIKLLNAENDKRLEVLNDREFMKHLEYQGNKNQYKQAVGEKINKNVQNILRVVQNNYDAYQNNEELQFKPTPGIIFISNPEVIDEYKNGFNNNHIRRKIQKSSSFSSTSSTSMSSEEPDFMRRNLKDVLEDMRKNVDLPSSDRHGELLVISRRNQNRLPRKDNNQDQSIEKTVWKEDPVKVKPKSKKDLPNFEKLEQVSRNKKDFSPRKRPKGYRPSSKLKFDSYKPKKENLKKRDDYRAYGRTSIPVIGKKVVYDSK